MSNEPRKLQRTPQDALEAYILHLEKAYYPWYRRSVSKNYYLWLIAQMVALLSGFGTALVAVILKEEQFRGFQTGRIILIILPIVGSLASTVLIQSRVNARWKLREEGRIAFQSLVTEGRRRFAAATTDAEWTAIHHELEQKTEEVEKSQSLGFFANSPNFT
jgi:hypothetical protein